jgi:diguanylate cyclase (GGDEF)-like protein/PAS domain S-box-containing protein
MANLNGETIPATLEAAIIAASSTSVIVMDERGVVVEWNPAAAQMLGYARHEALGCVLPDLVMGAENRQRTMMLMEALKDGSLATMTRLRRDVEVMHRDGRRFQAETVLTSFAFQGQSYYVLGFRDITSRKHLEQELLTQAAELEASKVELQQLARLDALTNLGNRRAFAEELEMAVAKVAHETRALTLLMLDVDGLKGVNDGQGHERGDELLRLVAQALQQSLRDQDRAYRLGGDEFAAILVHSSDIVLTVVEQRITATVKALNAGRFPNISISLGMASYPREAIDVTTLGHLADQRMYAQKIAHHAAMGRL